MLKARRDHYALLVNSGMDYTRAARTVGAGKRTGKVWRNGRPRATGRNERPSVDCYRGSMEQPRNAGARYLYQESGCASLICTASATAYAPQPARSAARPAP